MLLSLFPLSLGFPPVLEGLTRRFACSFPLHCPCFRCFLLSPHGCPSRLSSMVQFLVFHLVTFPSLCTQTLFLGFVSFSDIQFPVFFAASLSFAFLFLQSPCNTP